MSENRRGDTDDDTRDTGRMPPDASGAPASPRTGPTTEQPDGPRPRDAARGPRPVETGGRSQASVTALLRDLAGDAAELTRKEVALARGEIAHAIADLKTGTISMAAGGGVLYAGLLFLLAAATLGLATVMPAWLAALIVGAVVTLIGFIMVKSGQSRMTPEHLRPDRTTESLHKDSDMLHRRAS